MTDKNQQDTNNDNVRYVMVSPDNIQQNVANDEIDLRELWKAIWQGKWIIISTTLLSAIVSVFYALSLPNIYRSEVTLAPVSEEGSLRIPSQLGGLAALAGVNLGSSGSVDKTSLALEILNSRDFISRFIELNDLYIPLMAATSWNKATDELIIDPKKFDVLTQKWIRSVESGFDTKPNILESVEEFNKKLLVSKDKNSGIVRLSIEHYSPNYAMIWADKLVKSINEEMRTRELAEAERSIIYLNSQIEKTNVADIRLMLFSLIEEQTKRKMLANIREQYVFIVIDSASKPQKKIKPNRAFIVVGTSVFFIFITSIFVLFYSFRIKK